MEWHVENNQSLYFHFTDIYQELIRDKEMKKYVDYTNVGLCYYPIKDKILVLSFGGALSRKYYDFLVNSQHFSEYGYWNNTDPLEDVSDKDWKQRSKDWELAIGEDYLPSNHGLSREFDCNSYYTFYEAWKDRKLMNSILKEVRTDKRKRLTRKVTSLIEEKKKKSLLKGRDMKSLDYKESAKIRAKLKTYMNSNIAKEKIKTMKEKYKNDFVTITYDILFKQKFKIEKK